MKRIQRRILAAMVILSGSLVYATSAMASPPPTVCASGCAFTSIQAAITAAIPGNVITVGPGSYVEDLVVNKALTIDGSGASTILYPAESGPLCTVPSYASICPGGTNMVLIQASNVTIENMRLEGNNPNLTSGVTVGGADIDARNGIIEDYHTGVFNNTTVENVQISDVYHRGIYMSSGGANFNVTGNSVSNVQGDASSIAMFNFGGSGVFADNRVTLASDAISANWSTGTSFVDNVISESGSGVHTDNSGEFGSVDLIQGNEVSRCTIDGYGLFVFAQYGAVSVLNNSVVGCSVGLAVFGSQVSGATSTFAGNNVIGKHAVASLPNSTYGAFVVTDRLGYGTGDVNAVFTHNRFSGFATGLYVSQSPIFGGPGGNQANVTAHSNSIIDNVVGVNGDTSTVVNAKSNWWGCPQGPNTSGGCDSAIGTTAFDPWLTHAPGVGG